MKCWILAGVIALSCGSAIAAEYSMDFVAQHMAKRDHERGLPNDQQRVTAIASMLSVAADQCKRTNTEETAYMAVADKVMATRNLLADKGVDVSMYDLLDVLRSTLADGKKGRDCASVLSAYATLRQDPSITHIGAYKAVQSFRDVGALSANQ
ncbi:hypothetical protein [Pseudomonas nitroreducens]|uniref:hypothetical protein n=1 Tax=Pseudomonas nitroreducens TaxID=46680 RepID=UPI00147D0174|nr:hypothetical protein [Pseudomonas nitroreducens]NNN24364.1 hypothetical protein [Pseudomonas nitroreducens]